MVILRGKAAAPGRAAGPVCLIKSGPSGVRNAGEVSPEEQWKRFLRAQNAARIQFGNLIRQLQEEGNEEGADLFFTHIQLLEDVDFNAAVWENVDAGQSAEEAVEEASRLFAGMFARLDDPYMRERAADVTDVGRRLVGILSPVEAAAYPEADALLLGEELTPGGLMELDRSHVLGIALSGGSAASHTAILARTMGIPMVVGLEELPEVPHGCTALLDGGSGQLVLEPTEEQLAEAVPAEDGKREPIPGFPIRCNISLPEEADRVADCGGEGVGLFRSEFLFLGREEPPDEEEQYRAYRQVLESLSGQPVTVRTFDLGADKEAAFLKLPRETNPALGLRGIRLGLARPELLRTQLRALYRASAHGELSILLPMVTDLREVEQVKTLCGQVQLELALEGIPRAEHIPLGVMIETPVAALMAEELAKAVDFFSIGTNDLKQYTLARDRENPAVEQFAPDFHPALLRLVEMAVTAAHGAGIPVCVCGDLAGEEGGAALLRKLGVDELSVPPGRVGALRKVLTK